MEIWCLVSDHRRGISRSRSHSFADETQNFVDWIGNRARAAAGVKQTDRTRIRRHIFNHQRTRIAASKKFAGPVVDDDLAGERLCEGCAAGAFVVVRDADRRVERGNGAAA